MVVDSLAAELSAASKEEMMTKVKSMADTNNALSRYIDNLLAIVIDRIPDILEVRVRNESKKK